MWVCEALGQQSTLVVPRSHHELLGERPPRGRAVARRFGGGGNGGGGNSGSGGVGSGGLATVAPILIFAHVPVRGRDGVAKLIPQHHR